MGTTLRRWASPAGLAVVALVVLIVRGAEDGVGTGLAWGIPLLAVALLVSPVPYPRTRAAHAGDTTIYWKPGCSWCVLMRLGLLGVAGRARWVDVSVDPEAARFVQRVNDGNVTTPTVTAPSGSWTNPSSRLVRRLLTS